MIFTYCIFGIVLLALITAFVANIKDLKAINKTIEHHRQATDDYNEMMAKAERLRYIQSNMTAINSHRRKSSSSWGKTGLLFKNKS